MTGSSGDSFLHSSDANWENLIQIDSLFNDVTADLLTCVQSVAEHGAHVLYPKLVAGDFDTVELFLFVTLETAIRVNESLMERSDIGVLEMGFRVELSGKLASKQMAAH